MKAKVPTLAVLLAVVLGGGFLIFRHVKDKDKPKRESLAALSQLQNALSTGDGVALTEAIILPTALQGRTQAERAEFIAKALRDEISAEGLAVLRKEGQFGPLLEVFPQEGSNWAALAGVKIEDCVAFRLDRPKQPDMRAEVVLYRPSTLDSRPSTPFRVLRCNNVR